MGANDTPQPRSLDELQALLAARSMTPGWIRREKPILWPEMRSAFVPAHWRYAEAKEAQKAAGRLIGTDQAERRNFVMRNPAFAGQFPPAGNDIATLRTLICAYQSILPGEQARTHRHAPHALRVILESRGSYSVVDGDKHPMESGDVVLTPGWCWHGHGHDGTEQAYWFDGLDVPLTHLLEPMFFEEHPAGFAPVTRVTETSPMRFPFKQILSSLETQSTIDLPAPSMPTIALKVHRWDKGYANRPFRETVNTVYVVMRGSGRSTLGDASFDWEFGDTLAAPAWSRIEHRASEDSIVFSMSDEALMRWTRYYRREELS